MLPPVLLGVLLRHPRECEVPLGGILLVDQVGMTKIGEDKVETDRFEGMPWYAVGKSMVRQSADGYYKLVAYRVEDDLEVLVIAPDGTSKSFSQPMVKA